MTAKSNGNGNYKEYVVALICLVMVGSLAQGVVLCFGADGHAEFESAFHKSCDGSVHSHHGEEKQLTSETDHERDKHCGPCVDIPLSASYAKISRVYKQANRTFSLPFTNMIADGDKFGISAHNFASNSFACTCRTAALRTVILLV